MRTFPVAKAGVLASCLLAFAVVAISRCRPTVPFAKATLSLLSYTNDMWYTSMPTNTVTAICVLSNRTSRHYFGFHGDIQIKTDHGWMTNFEGRQEMSTDIGPHAVWVLRFLPPADTNPWRCSVELIDITYSTHVRPKWQGLVINLLQRAGIKFERQYVIWSPELTR